MERLQAAMEKAREARQQETGVVVAAVDPRRAPSPSAASGAVTSEDSWAALRPLERSDAAKKARLRLPALGSGAEAAPFDILRTRIIQQAGANNWRRIAIVSATAGSGKSTTVANLLFSFSRQFDLSVIAFDLDLRRSNLMKLLGQIPEHGIADLIEGRTDFAEHGLRIGLNVAVALNNAPIAQSAELLHSQKTRDALAAIEEAYQPSLMLFDTAPLIGVDDTYGFLGGNADAALLIAAADETPIEQIDAAERQLAEVTNVMGIVLNKARFHQENYY